MNEKLKLTIIILVSVLLEMLVVFLILYLSFPKESISQTNEQPLDTPPPVLSSTTALTVVDKTNKNDNDLEVHQTYVAEVNGQRMEVPIVTTENNNNGTKAIVTQEIDMTNVISYASTIERDKAKKEYKKNWEIGIGYGVHRGDNYLALEVQRNYSKNKAVSCEIHQDIRNLKYTTGWELKHKWMF